mmetsp:Transcript_101769/g.263646  ORF Transcript_101769/g.263646 Transcript_101769/m.263646 type:complete len:143 (+) Transcript_101769:269-697(+)
MASSAMTNGPAPVPARRTPIGFNDEPEEARFLFGAANPRLARRTGGAGGQQAVSSFWQPSTAAEDARPSVAVSRLIETSRSAAVETILDEQASKNKSLVAAGEKALQRLRASRTLLPGHAVYMRRVWQQPKRHQHSPTDNEA